MNLTNKLGKNVVATGAALDIAQHLAANDVVLFDVVVAEDRRDLELTAMRQFEAGKPVTLAGRTWEWGDFMQYLQWASKDAQPKHVLLPLRYNLSDLNAELRKRYKETWTTLSQEKRNAVAYSLGINPDDCYLQQVLHRNKNNKVVFGWCLVGAERQDRAWKDSGLASPEAILFSTDAGLCSDIDRLRQKGVLSRGN